MVILGCAPFRPAFDRLTEELLDLTAGVRGDASAGFALVLDCCSCSCCGCVINCH